MLGWCKEVVSEDKTYIIGRQGFRVCSQHLHPMASSVVANAIQNEPAKVKSLLAPVRIALETMPRLLYSSYDSETKRNDGQVMTSPECNWCSPIQQIC